MLTLAAVDPEGGVVDFALSGGEDQDLFTVSGDQLAFTAAPDFEVPTDADGNNVYLVQVTATDEAGGATTQDLSITVANDPADEPPSPNEPPPPNEPPAFTIDAVVDENTTAVLTLAAADPEGGVVDFALSGGEDQDLFTVSGDQLAFTAAPDFEVPTDADGNNVYLVQVTATDEAGGATTQDLSITVANDPAEEPPSPEEPIEVAALDFLL